ncbi:type II toxin-antitoxin system HipA family toxin [Kordiimonas pumila]|uniref:Type II toxin-antitoxin system HipA family toxin n=1 Tax=Kordiimonas pumila TaxID=2161677 RepID=A0ABV7D6P9_9PROT|nr:HipA domain-containing protein [Kordiimonas pumila]
MAVNLWGKVYYQDTFAGIISQEAGGRCSFEYDEAYLNSTLPAISFTLPKRSASHLHEDGLHPFFDNLCAEGWLKNVQARALGLRKNDRFALLLAFGSDLAGAVHVEDPQPVHDVKIDLDDPENYAALSARASLSGVQPKLGAIKEGRKFRAARQGELATHIAKLPSGTHPNIVALEYLTTQACASLLKGDAVAELTIASLEDVVEAALLVKRFDRSEDGTRLHFEEFNQLLGQKSEDKYDGCYEDMANFILRNADICLKTECDILFRRIMACIVTGNTDAHLKNFAMMHTAQGLRLTPSYDLVAAACYPEYQTIALGLENAHGMSIGKLSAKNIVRLGMLYGLPEGAIMFAVEDFAGRMDRAHDNIDKAKNIEEHIKDKLHEQMEKRWNGIFASIGTYLLKKQ